MVYGLDVSEPINVSPAKKSTLATVPSGSAGFAASGTFVPAVTLEPVIGLVSDTVGDWLAPAHLVPLMVKLVGAVLVPLNVPLKPISMDWLAVSVLFQSRLVAVT